MEILINKPQTDDAKRSVLTREQKKKNSTHSTIHYYHFDRRAFENIIVFHIFFNRRVKFNKIQSQLEVCERRVACVACRAIETQKAQAIETSVECLKRHT